MPEVTRADGRARENETDLIENLVLLDDDTYEAGPSPVDRTPHMEDWGPFATHKD